MNLKISFSIFFFATLVAAQETNCTAKEFMKLQAKDLHELSEDEKSRLSRSLKPYLGEDNSRSAWKAKELLAALGDEVAIQEIVAAATNASARTRMVAQAALTRTSNASLIRRYAQDLFLDEPAHQQLIGGEVLLLRKSGLAVEVILSVLSKNEVFTSDVRNWAQEMNFVKRYQVREILRLWWKKNASHFDNEDYSSVLPLSSNEYSLSESDFKPKFTGGSWNKVKVSP